MTPENESSPSNTDTESLHPWRTLWQLASVYQGKFLIVVLFSLLASSTDLIAPLIYRTAINDVAGLFVDTGGRLEDAQIPDEEAATPVTPALAVTPAPEVSPSNSRPS